MTPQERSAHEDHVTSALRAAGIQPRSEDVAALSEGYTELLAMTRILVDMLDQENAAELGTCAPDR